MLNRAAKAFEPPKSKNDALAKQLFPSSSPSQDGNIKDVFKKKNTQTSQSIGGFTNYTNPTTALRSKSPNVTARVGLNGKTLSVSSVSSNSAGLSSLFSRKDSFQNTANTIDLTNDEPLKQRNSQIHHTAIVFDENDFSDDADLDLDMEYELPITMAPPKPPAPKPAAPQPSPYELPKLNPPPQDQNPTSSAITWSSSSPSHKRTPPGALRRQREVEASQDADINPRPAKRRTLPWAAKRAEEAELAEMKEERELALAAIASSASAKKLCFRCRKTGHHMDDCPEPKSKGNVLEYTPAPKEKRMPWNTTGSAIAEEKKKFKDKQKARKSDGATEAPQRAKAKAVLAPITLSGEQQRVLKLVVDEKKSVFFTGSAGTGKSVLMRSIIGELRKKYSREPDRVAVTASTGLAACNIGGVTLHSFGGIGLGKEDVPTLVKKIKRNPKAKNRWLRTKILIIDEVSMVDGDLFDKLEGIARAMRNNGRPFGGIQLVITGDFFQLPPVPDYDKKDRAIKFAFDAGTWSTAIHHTIGLTEVFRQKDPVFANMLNEMRLGKITNETIAAFRKLSRKLNYEDSLEATELFPTRNEVENSNAFKMRALHGKAYNYEARDTGTITDVAMREKLLANMMAPKTLQLKKGAQVMLIKNMDDGLVNGSLGKVVAFMSEKTFELYDAHPDMFGEDISSVDVDEEVMRARMSLKSFSKKEPNSNEDYPLVRFIAADGTSRDLLILREEWKIELPNGEIQAQRSQLPLILAWALSIHKAQGQTLERVKIDLKKIFEKGQAYVALSRATSQEGLEVQNFDKNKVMAHPRVAQFYNSLYSVNKALEHPTVAKPIPAKKASTYEEDFMNAEQVNGFDFDEEEEAMAAYG